MFYFNTNSYKEKMNFIQLRKLEILNYLKDSLERKIASVNASIEVLQKQIDRDMQKDIIN